MAFLLCYSLDINISHVHINYKHAKVSQSKIFVTSSGAGSWCEVNSSLFMSLWETGHGKRKNVKRSWPGAASQLLGTEFFCLSLQGKRDTGRGMRDLNDDPHQTK
jgi:hypothetical protein